MTALRQFTDDELREELERREGRRETVLEGMVAFAFAGPRSAKQFLERIGEAISPSLELGEGRLLPRDGNCEVVLPYRYSAISASRSDVGRFAWDAGARIGRDSGRQRLYPIGLVVTVDGGE